MCCGYIRGLGGGVGSQFFSHSAVKMIKQCALVFGRSSDSSIFNNNCKTSFIIKCELLKSDKNNILSDILLLNKT